MTDREVNIIEDYKNNIAIKEICRTHKCSDRIVYKLIKEHKVSRYNHIKTVLDSDLELKYYFYGLIASDGYLYKPKNRIELSLNNDDRHIIELFADKFNININDRKIHNQSRIIFANKEVYAELEALGITQLKSETLSLKIDFIPDKYLHHFIRGYFDRDGCVHFLGEYKKDLTKRTVCVNQIRFDICGNEDTMQKFYNIFHKNNIHLKLYSDISKITSFSFCRIITGDRNIVYKAYDYLYHDAKYYLNRKNSIFINNKEILFKNKSR